MHRHRQYLRIYKWVKTNIKFIKKQIVEFAQTNCLGGAIEYLWRFKRRRKIKFIVSNLQ